MKDDLNIEPVKNVHVAIAKEGDIGWQVYLINKSDKNLHNVLVASRGYGEIEGNKKETSVLRHHFDDLPANSSLVIEPIMEDLFELFNEYWVSYYIDNQIFDKKFVFSPGAFISDNMIDLPLINKKGILHN